MRKYEMLMILRPATEDTRREAIIDEIRKFIEDKNGSMTKVDVWGLRKLEYPIKRENEGQYVVVNFSSGTDIVRDLERNLRMKDEVLRVKTLVIEKEKK